MVLQDHVSTKGGDDATVRDGRRQYSQPTEMVVWDLFELVLPKERADQLCSTQLGSCFSDKNHTRDQVGVHRSVHDSLATAM